MSVEIIDVTRPPAGLTPLVGDSVYDDVDTFSSVGTDNAAALNALRDYCEADKMRPRVWYFPSGGYAYSDAKWFPNLDHFEIIGTKRSVIGCTADTPVDAERAWAGGTGDIFRAVKRSSLASYSSDTGSLFETALAGTNVLTLITQSEIANFAAGKRVITLGYNMQNSGYPFNYKFFQWHVIASVDTEAGTITLQDKLKYDFRDDWYPYDTGDNIIGPATIISLDREDYHYPRFLKIKGITIANNPVSNNPNGISLCAEHVLLEELTHHGNLWPQQSILYDVAGGYYEHTNDLDKIVDSLTIKNITSDTLLGPATSINNVLVENSKFKGICRLASRSFQLINNEFDLSQSEHLYGWLGDRQIAPVLSAVARGNRIIAPLEMDCLVDNLLTNEVIIDSSSAGEFKVAIADVVDSYYTLNEGMIIQSSDGETRAKITELGYDGADMYVKHDGGYTFTGSVFASSFMHLDIDDSNVIVGPDNDRQFKKHRRPLEFRLHGRANTTGALRRFMAVKQGCKLDSITFTLVTASQSASPNHFYALRVKESAADAWTSVFVGNTASNGARVKVSDVSTGAVSWSAGWANNSANAFTGVANFAQLVIASALAPSGIPANMDFGDDSEAPVFDLELSGSAIA